MDVKCLKKIFWLWSALVLAPQQLGLAHPASSIPPKYTNMSLIQQVLLCTRELWGLEILLSWSYGVDKKKNSLTFPDPFPTTQQEEKEEKEKEETIKTFLSIHFQAQWNPAV